MGSSCFHDWQFLSHFNLTDVIYETSLINKKLWSEILCKRLSSNSDNDSK